MLKFTVVHNNSFILNITCRYSQKIFLPLIVYMCKDTQKHFKEYVDMLNVNLFFMKSKLKFLLFFFLIKCIFHETL